MDFRSTEARLIDRAFLTGQMASREVSAGPRAEPGNVFVNAVTHQMYGKTALGNFYRIDLNTQQFNMLNASRTRFEPMPRLPRPDRLIPEARIAREELLPAATWGQWFVHGVLPKLGVAALITGAGIATGTIVRAHLHHGHHHPHDDIAHDHEVHEPAINDGNTSVQPGIWQRLNPHPQFLAGDADGIGDLPMNDDFTWQGHDDVENPMNQGLGWVPWDDGVSTEDFVWSDLPGMQQAVIGATGIGMGYGFYKLFVADADVAQRRIDDAINGQHA